NSLLTKGAHAEAYFNPPKLHPSEPNYIWLEAGTNFGVKNDSDPASNHQASKAHLTTLLDGAGISWKAYQENITGTTCPLSSSGLYAAKHNPMIFFDDVTGVNNPKSAYCIEHERPYTELAPDMASGKVARYNFITPNLCNDMHNSSGCTTTNSILNGDNWLKQEIPKILASDAYKKGGIIFITWDEGEGGDGPIGMIVLSSGAKVGYSNTIRYTHSSTLRTVQEIFGVQPLLGDAANATSMSDLFSVFPGPGTSLPTNTPVSPTKTPVLTNTQAPPTATVTPAKTATPVNTATVAPPSSTPIVSGGGGSITVDVAADAYISDAGPTTNFGSSPTLRTDASPVIQSYLRFIVPPLSANVVSAQLRVYANTGVSTGYSVSGTTGSWTETGLTFSNAPIFGSSVGNSGPITAFTWTTIDVTSLVKGSGQYNFVMTTTSNTATSLVSKEGAAGQRPQLIVNMGTNTGNQTPQPTTTPIATLAPINTATAVPTMTLPAPTNTAIATVVAEGLTATGVPPSNTALPPPSSPTPSGPTFTVEVNPSSGTVGSTMSAVLKMSNMVNLYGLQAECKVDPNILGGIGHIEGDIFTSANSFIVDSGFQTDGTWSVAASLLNPAPAFTGSGTAFSLNFTVKNVGQTPVECTALAVDVNGNLLPIAVVNSTFDSTQSAPPTPVPTTIPPTFTPAPPTAEPLPTQTPTFEPTLPPQPGAISGVVKYEKHPDQSGIAITISQNGTSVAQGQSGADGSFQFSNVPVGQYLVQFSAQGYLSASTTVDVQAGEGATIQITLLAGDIDNNGVIDLADASLIGANYRIQAPPAPVQADLNGDGFINL
ncbi:MAG: alkaline phosphatase family protein, partial [Chloroflexota bacterium]